MYLHRLLIEVGKWFNYITSSGYDKNIHFHLETWKYTFENVALPDGGIHCCVAMNFRKSI